MTNGNEKKGLFEQLNGSKNTKKSSCCGNYEIEEIPEENTEKENETKEQVNGSEKAKISSCCGKPEVEKDNEKEPPKDRGNSCCR
jgi:hypothetical protein